MESAFELLTTTTAWMTTTTSRQLTTTTIVEKLPLLVLLICSSTRMTATASICEPINIPTCQTMTYNVTQMPNLLHHSTQQNARLVFDQYLPLLNTSCDGGDGSLRFYLCAMFAPVCPVEFRQPVIWPCRAVCLRARAGCEPVLERHGLSWPTELDCAQLPVYENGVCISPEALDATPPVGAGNFRFYFYRSSRITSSNFFTS